VRLRWRLVDEDAPLRRAVVTGEQRSARSNYAMNGHGRSDVGVGVALRLSQCLWPHCRATRYLLRGWRTSCSEWKQCECQGFSKDGGQMRELRSRRRRRRAQSGARPTQILTESRRSTSPGRTISILGWPTSYARDRGDCCSRHWQYRSGDGRHIVADKARASECWAFAPARVEMCGNVKRDARVRYAPCRG